MSSKTVAMAQTQPEQYVKVLAIRAGEAPDVLEHRARVVRIETNGDYIVEFNKQQYVATSVAPTK